mmetsp:Transcript_21736/g.39439  ORF Transcript_21736/g.39439 Transcript_21736/m.39439 type:complete len:146 (+) Transcript_21736:1042-1479(+)
MTTQIMLGRLLVVPAISLSSLPKDTGMKICLLNEVMTPVVFSGVRNPLSNFTVAAMADMGLMTSTTMVRIPTLLMTWGVCRTSCPEAFSFRKRGLGSTNRRQLAEEAKMIIKNDFKDILHCAIITMNWKKAILFKAKRAIMSWRK